MTTEENKEIIRCHWDELMNRHEAGKIEEFYAPDVDNHTSHPSLPFGIESVNVIIPSLFAAVPDQKWEVEQLVAEGDMVACYVRWSGTHCGGTFREMEIPPGGRFSVEHVHLFRLAGGKIVEHWAVRDDLGMMQQLRADPE
ncbi:MAG: ester cyclase [Chloroflexota bacterium]|nr:ester cyclase [Chloroflexota bacterium]